METIKVAAFDKTGTITTGKPAVTDAIAYANNEEHALLAAAALVEARSEHPIARAVVNYATEHGYNDGMSLDTFEAIPGQGVRAGIGNAHRLVGTQRLLNTPNLIVPADFLAQR